MWKNISKGQACVEPIYASICHVNLFIETYGDRSFHEFLIQASNLYQPQGDIVPKIVNAPQDDDDDSEDE